MIKNIARRDFLKTTSLAGLAFAISPFNSKNHKPLLSFSTLGCPDWSLTKILDFAVENGYDGIELRGIQRQLDLTKCTEFGSQENILATLNRFKDKKLKIVDLCASAEMHHADPSERRKNLDEAKSFISLAHQLSCPYIRVFPNNIPKDRERSESIDLIVKGLKELGGYARGTGVTVLMETHGDIVQSEDVEKIMRSVELPNVGIVWDIVNMWSVTREPVSGVYAKLKKYIRHTHIKDLKLVGGEENNVLLGKGDTPIFDAIDILSKNKYNGYYSFEWEKLWYPKIEEPEVAIADYANVMRKHFNM
jgi:sugar phosphate isomerase/epimerase